MVTSKDFCNALKRLGVKEGDSILTHSSFKSLGETENGADTVICAMLEAVGESGTVIFPTLCKDDWNNIYKNWHLDAPSFVGYLSNYFRKLPNAKRSNQATHSVAAIGAKADFLTETHGESGLRYGIFGSTPFSADSPWEKMYKLNTKILFLGVEVLYCTFRHYAEYVYMDECLKKAEKSPRYTELKEQVWCYDHFDDGGVWPHILNKYVCDILEKEGKLRRTKCGNAELILFSSTDFVDKSIELLKMRDPEALSRDIKQTFDWFKEIDAL